MQNETINKIKERAKDMQYFQSFIEEFEIWSRMNIVTEEKFMDVKIILGNILVFTLSNSHLIRFYLKEKLSSNPLLFSSVFEIGRYVKQGNNILPTKLTSLNVNVKIKNSDNGFIVYIDEIEYSDKSLYFDSLFKKMIAALPNMYNE